MSETFSLAVEALRKQQTFKDTPQERLEKLVVDAVRNQQDGFGTPLDLAERKARCAYNEAAKKTTRRNLHL